MQDTRVVILAGGKGRRLRPYTAVFPKPLVPIGDVPILEVVLRQLRHFGFRKVTLSVNHLAELIEAFFGDGAKLGLEISYCREDRPLGTAGSLSLVRETTDPVLVMNGDLLTTLDLSAIVDHHRRSGAAATIGAFPRTVDVDFGVLDVDDSGDLRTYREKPRLDYLVSMGVNVLSDHALGLIPKGEYLDMPTLMGRLVAEGARVSTFRSDCEWLDIGRTDDYERAIELFEGARNRYLWE